MFRQLQSRARILDRPLPGPLALRPWWLLVAAALLVVPQVLGNAYYVHVLVFSGIAIILALGLNLLLGFAGQISLAQAAFWGIGAYTSAIVTTKFGVSPWLALPIDLLVTMFFGVLVALPAVKVKGHYLAIITISINEIVRMVFVNWRGVTGGAIGLLGIPRLTLGATVLRDETQFYYVVLIALALCTAFASWLIRSPVGSTFRAIREDEIAAEAAGIRLSAYKLLAFVICAAYAGVAGWLYAHYMAYLSPEVFSLNESTMLLAMAVLGGLGSLWGPAIGALLLTISRELLRSLQSFQLIAYGIMIVVIVVFLPTGLVTLPSVHWGEVREHLVHRMQRRRHTRSRARRGAQAGTSRLEGRTQ